MSSTYADIAFPTPVRRLFTYSVPAGMEVHPGMRVWVPLRNEKAIGMVIGLHDRTPSFTTKPLLRILDRQPVLSGVMLKLIDWIHRFYYCSQGEAVDPVAQFQHDAAQYRLSIQHPKQGLCRERGRPVMKPDDHADRLLVPERNPDPHPRMHLHTGRNRVGEEPPDRCRKRNICIG